MEDSAAAAAAAAARMSAVRTRAQPTQPRMRALAVRSRSVLPSKLVALATLSPDLNMVPPRPPPTRYNKLYRLWLLAMTTDSHTVSRANRY